MCDIPLKSQEGIEFKPVTAALALTSLSEIPALITVFISVQSFCRFAFMHDKFPSELHIESLMSSNLRIA